MKKLKCDMFKDCTASITHIDQKGYLYCTTHGIMRKRVISTRKLKPVEIERLQAGLAISSKGQTKLERIIELCADNSIEIVSHGLAPNPNGFCYEAPDNTPKEIHKRLNDMLNSLSKSDERKLIELTF